ncbi:MAG: hypothetical protein LQ338_008081 [Usnochroma carphineum]|nr:MAG: hypothetical protein LQ338_008081 [Usnochroma carphineum]
MPNNPAPTSAQDEIEDRSSLHVGPVTSSRVEDWREDVLTHSEGRRRLSNAKEQTHTDSDERQRIERLRNYDLTREMAPAPWEHPEEYRRWAEENSQVIDDDSASPHGSPGSGVAGPSGEAHRNSRENQNGKEEQQHRQGSNGSEEGRGGGGDSKEEDIPGGRKGKQKSEKTQAHVQS